MESNNAYKMIHHNHVEFIPDMQGWFNSWLNSPYQHVKEEKSYDWINWHRKGIWQKSKTHSWKKKILSQLGIEGITSI